MIHFKIVEFILVAVCLQSILFSLFLAVKSIKERLKQNIFLSFCVFVFSFIVLKGWYNGSGYYLENPVFLFLPLYLTLALGPLFYFYVNLLLKKDFKFKKVNFLHFIPALLQFLYHLSNFIKPAEDRIAYFQNEYFTGFLIYEEILGILSMIIYFIFSKKILKEYHHHVFINHSGLRKDLYKWINSFINAAFVMLGLWITLAFIDFFFYDYQKSYSFYYSIYFLIVLFSYWMVYKGFIVTSKINPILQFESKTDSYSLPKNELEGYLKVLIDSMEEDKHYLNPKLSLVDLANELEINPKYLSQILNQNLNINFRDYVNKYRIEMAKEELISPKNAHLTITAIGDKCGFNSKSTFNNVFKKHTNQTPTEYIRENRI